MFKSKLYSLIFLLALLTGILIPSDLFAQGNEFEAISFNEIKSANLSATAINGSDNITNQIPSGRILFYKTNEGRYGKLLIKIYGYDLELKWETYNSDGSVYSKGDDLVIRGTYSCDLDSGRESSTSSDFWWKQATSVERFLVPKNGAQFVLARDLAVKQEALTLGAFIGVLKTLYDIAKKSKSFYDTHLSDSLSAEEIRFNALIDEMNELHLKEILRQAWAAIDYFSYATSIDSDREDYKDLLHNQLAHVAELALQAKSGLQTEIADQPPKRAVKLAEAHALITPILAATGRELGWDEVKIKEIFADAVVSNHVLLGAPHTNHADLPFYWNNKGKLHKAYKTNDITHEEYNNLRVIIWNSQELAKKASGIQYKYAYWIHSDIHNDDTHIYNQCLSRSGENVIAKNCMLSEGADQIWSFETTEQGYVKIKFLNSCLARTRKLLFFGVKPSMERCSNDSSNQLWEWIGDKIVVPTESDSIDERKFLYIRTDGSLRMKSETLPYTTGDFPSFRVLHKDEPLDNKTDFVGYKNRRVIGSDVKYESSTFKCPVGMAVQGVIASEGFNNFGLICAPTRSGWRRRPTVEEQLASAAVISYGTSVVNGYTTDAGGDPFWYYYNGINSGSLTGGTAVRHNYKVCPPNYFINSIKAHFLPPGYIFGLENFTCVSKEHSVRIPLPTGQFGWRIPSSDPWYFRREAICPFHDTAYTGMKVFRTPGTKTGGFEAECFTHRKTITNLVGDKDGFGLGLREGGRRAASEGFFNKREAGDPAFTDTLQTTRPTFSYTHEFNLAGHGDILGAQINLMTLGVQDGDTQATGSNTDIRLYVDGVEIPRAFDKVDQFSMKNSVWGQSAGLVTIALPDSVLDQLEDGAIEVKIETMQHGSGGLDIFAIDYSELVISTTR